MSNENKVRKDALFFLDVGAENHPNKDGIITVLVSYDNKEKIKSLKELATGILNWIDMNEQASGGNATIRAGQVRRYKTRKELGISDDIGWTHDDSQNFVVVGQVGDKSAWAVQDVNGQNSRMVRAVDLENNTLIVGEA